MSFDGIDFHKDPLQHLTTLFINKEFKQLEKESFMIINDSRYDYIDVKGELLKTTYLLSLQGNAGGATYLKQLMMRLYPNDPMVWNNLANQMITNENIPEAKRCLQKTIEEGGDSKESEKAKKMLKELNEE